MSDRESRIAEWLRKATLDKESFYWLLQADTDLRETSVFHAQQAAEKFLKAAWVSQGLVPPKSHDLVFLLDQASTGFLQKVEERHRKAALLLNNYAVEIRYPEVSWDLPATPDIQAAESAMNLIEQLVQDWLQE